jgi:hypothetical protein
MADINERGNSSANVFSLGIGKANSAQAYRGCPEAFQAE